MQRSASPLGVAGCALEAAIAKVRAELEQTVVAGKAELMELVLKVQE